MPGCVASPGRDRQLEDALAECDRLRDRVVELERMLAEARAR
jgi:hypothetical protein